MTFASHPPVISLRQLRKSYDSLEVLKGVDLEAREGDVISLIGSSGSGTVSYTHLTLPTNSGV
mgnify:CR=1 FL=1